MRPLPIVVLLVLLLSPPFPAARSQPIGLEAQTQAAFKRQFDTGRDYEQARNCVAIQQARHDQLSAEVRDSDTGGRDAERLRGDIREEEQALALYDANPNQPPTTREANAQWERGRVLRTGTPAGSTPRPILDLRDRLTAATARSPRTAELQGQLAAVDAELKRCQDRLPAAREAFQRAKDAYYALIGAVFPADNADLARIGQKAAGLSAGAEACAARTCPSVDCVATSRRLQSLADAEVNLAAMHRQLQQAERDALDHLKSLERQVAESQARGEKLKTALAWQVGLYATASLLLDAASLLEGFQGAKGVTAFSDTLSELDDLYEMTKDLESSLETIGNTLRPGTVQGGITTLETSLGEAVGTDVATYKSHLSDLNNALREGVAFKRFGGKGAFWASKNRVDIQRSLGQLVGRIGKDQVKASMEARIGRLQELAETLAAESAVVGPASSQLWLVRNRREAAERSLKSVRLALETLRDCVRACPAASYRAEALPDFEIDRRAGRVDGVAKDWGEALRYFNGRLPSLMTGQEEGELVVRELVCRGAPMVLIFKVFDRASSDPQRFGGSLVGGVNDVTSQMLARPPRTVGATYALPLTPVLERLPDGRVVVRFETRDPVIDVDAAMPRARDQAARRELALLQARVKRARLPASAPTQSAAGGYDIDAREAFGDLPTLGPVPAAMSLCSGTPGSPPPANACPPASRN